MTEENVTKTKAIINEALENFFIASNPKSSLTYLEDWFLLAMQNEEYEDTVTRIPAVEHYKALRRFLLELDQLPDLDFLELKGSC